MITENCLVCKKYLNYISEQELGMCKSCDDITLQISNEQLKIENKNP